MMKRMECRNRGDYYSQFAQDVIDFSSEYGLSQGSSYVASNVKGPLAIFPNYGDYTSACVFRTYGIWWDCCPSKMQPVKRCRYISGDYLDLSLERSVIIDSVLLYETYNPGALVRILAAYPMKDLGPINARGFQWIELWRSDQPEGGLQPKSRVFSPSLHRRPTQATKLIRLEFNSSKCKYYTELDAVEVKGYLPAQSSGTEDLYFDNLINSGISLSGQIPSRKEMMGDCSMKSQLLKATERLSIEDVRSTDNGLFDKLPIELLLYIFEYLDLRDLLRASSVSRLFFSLSTEIITSCRELNLREFWPNLCDEALELLRPRELKRLDMSWSGNYRQISPLGFRNFLNFNGRNLTTLVLASCQFVDDSCISCISEECQQLRELDLSSCRNITSQGFETLSRLSGTLTRLMLYRSLIDDSTINSILFKCHNMQHLCLGSCTLISNYDNVADTIGLYCKGMLSIDFWRARSLTGDGLTSILENCHQLEELDLGWCSEIRSSTQCITNLVRKCTKLKKLFLTANRTVTDADLQAMSLSLADLRQFDILGNASISADAVRQLLLSCPRLCMLDVSFCKQLTHSHVHAWSREFPHCSILMSYQDQVDNNALSTAGNSNRPFIQPILPNIVMARN